MVFSDLFFIFAFLPLFMVCYFLGYIIDRKWLSMDGQNWMTTRNAVLVVFSLIFYAWGEPLYVFLMLVSVMVNYLAGLCIDRQEKFRKLMLVIGLVCNIIILGTFKYLGFFAQILTDIGLTVSIPKISLPIGISFYTFQSISYLIDIYRREVPVQKRFSDLLLYISMFPQLIAGPIVRYDLVAHEINNRHVSANDVCEGGYRFLIGLGKKVILANQFSEVADQFLAGGLSHLSTSGACVGILAYTMQIFFDFSGYSDMAIGLGHCLGFHFPENFCHPYCCDSITDFWRRWHMSLGSFFRDYVYIPMGGNRRHQALNILVVWFLTGMWHGASWNFIIWGVYFGAIVTMEKYTLLKIKRYIPALLLHVYSMILVVIGWGIFYFDDFKRMTRFFDVLFAGIFSGKPVAIYDFTAESAVMDNFWLWIVGVVMCLPVYDTVVSMYQSVFRKETALARNISLATRIVVSVALLMLSISLLVGATNNAFIYTRF